MQYINKEQGMHTSHISVHICARLGVSTSSFMPRHDSQRNLSDLVAHTLEPNVFVLFISFLVLQSIFVGMFLFICLCPFFSQVILLLLDHGSQFLFWPRNSLNYANAYIYYQTTKTGSKFFHLILLDIKRKQCLFIFVQLICKKFKQLDR